MSKVNFISEPNAEESINLAIVSKTDVEYDPEAVGEVIYEDQEFGMMEPPCHTACFKYISDDALDETFGEFKFEEIRNSYDFSQFIDDLFNKLNHVFLYDDKKDTFKEIEKSKFMELFNDKSKNYSLKLIEYEIGTD